MLCLEWGFPVGSVVKSPPANAGDAGSIPWLEQIPWSRKWQSTTVFLPGHVYGQRNLAGNSPWDHKELDMTEQLSTTQQPFAYSGSISQLWEKEFRRINMVEKNREFQDPQFLSDW